MLGLPGPGDLTLPRVDVDVGGPERHGSVCVCVCSKIAEPRSGAGTLAAGDFLGSLGRMP